MTVAIILVNTQMPENIGSAARAMANFGFFDLRLVGPRCEWPNERAYVLACHASLVLDNCKAYMTVDEAVADLNYLYATSARKRDMEKSIISSRGIGSDMKQRHNGTKFGIMFGPEDDGLSNHSLRLADKLVMVPTQDNYLSMNIAHAVCVICYSIADIVFNTRHLSAQASKDEVSAMLTHLESELEEKRFFRVDQKKPEMMKNIGAMFAKAALTSQEVRTIRGIIKMLVGKKGPTSSM